MAYAPAYSASKHGVVGFSRSFTACAALDCVRVNCICPEFVNTKLVTDKLEFTSSDVVQHIGLLE